MIHKVGGTHKFELKREFIDNYAIGRNFDLEIAQDANDYDKSFIGTSGVTTSDLAFFFDFNDPLSFSGGTNLLSLVSWTGSTTSGFTIEDIGLTGVDTGIVSAITGVSMTFISGENRVQLFQVTANTGTTQYYSGYSSTTFSYPIVVINSAQTTGFSWSAIGSYNEFGGGFYQGFYKLYGFPYEVLPTRTKKGWTLSTWLKLNQDSSIFSALTSGSTILNDAYPNNSGFFFYMGTRAENKFWNNFSGETALTTSNSAVTFSAFTYYTGSTSAITKEAAINGIGFRITPDNRIGWRVIRYSADTTGTTQPAFVEEGYTAFPMTTGTTGNSWVNLSITWSRYMTLEECCDSGGTNCILVPPPMSATCENNPPTSQKGDLIFFVNARPIYRITNFEEPIFKELETYQELQEGVPFNISVGGGTQGLLETRTFGGPDLADTGLTITNNFAGTFEGGISKVRFYLRPLNVTEIIHNFLAESSIFAKNENFGGRIIFIDPPFTL